MPFRLALALLLCSAPASPLATPPIEIGNLTVQFPAGLRPERSPKGTWVATDGVSRLVLVDVAEDQPVQCASAEARAQGLRAGKTPAGFDTCTIARAADGGEASGAMVIALVKTIAGVAVVTSISTDEVAARRDAAAVADSVRVSERFARRLAQGRDRRMIGCFERYSDSSMQSTSSTKVCYRADGTYWSRTHLSLVNWRGELRGVLSSRWTVAKGLWSVHDGWLETWTADDGGSRQRIRFGERGFFLTDGAENDPDEEYWAKVVDGDVAPEPGEAAFEGYGWYEGDDWDD